jgi:hydrogenase-4 component E
MQEILDPLLIVVLAVNFVALGVSRVGGVISAVALQGGLVGLMPLFLYPEVGIRVIILMVVTIGLKAFIIPRLQVRALREAQIRHDIQPVISFMSCVLMGAVGTALAMIFSSTMPLADAHTDLLVVPASLATVWTGFLMLTTRKRAINQVLGYLVLENGIVLFGLLLLEAMPFLVEIGVLLDLFTGVFVMGIIIHHISREFASLSTDYLTQLKE